MVYWGYILGLYRDNGKEAGNSRDFRGLYRGYIGVIQGMMEKNMGSTISGLGFRA